MMRANGKRTGYQDGGEVEWSQLAGGPPTRGQPEWTQLAGGPPTRGQQEYTQLAGGPPTPYPRGYNYPSQATRPGKAASGSDPGRSIRAKAMGMALADEKEEEAYYQGSAKKRKALDRSGYAPGWAREESDYARGGPVEPREEDTVYGSTAPDWTPEAYSAALRKAEMEGEVGYQAGGEVAPPAQQERSPLGQVLDYTRKQFGLDQIGQPRTGYQEGGEVTDDDAAERLRAQQEREALERAQAIARQPAAQDEGAAVERPAAPREPSWGDRLTGLLGVGQAAAAEAPQTARAPSAPTGYAPPPSPTEPAPVSPEAGWGEVLGAAAKRPFEKAYEYVTGPPDPFDTTTPRAFGEPAGAQTPRAPFDWVKKGIAGYLNGDRALPPEQMTQVIEANPLGNHNVDVQRAFDALKRKGDIDTASQLVQGLRPMYGNLLAYGQAAIDQGKPEAAMRFLEKAHDLLPNERRMSIRQGEGGNFAVTIAPDRAGAGPASTYNLSPEQFRALAHGPAMQFDHAADNTIEKNLQILSRGADLPVPPPGTRAGPGGIPFPEPKDPSTGRPVAAAQVVPSAAPQTAEDRVRAMTRRRDPNEPAVPREYDAAFANEYNARRQALLPSDPASQARAAEFERRAAPGYQAAVSREVAKANAADEARRAALPAPPEGMRGGYMPNREIAPPGYYAHRTLVEPQRTEWATAKHYDPKTGRITGESRTPHTTPVDQASIEANRREEAADQVRYQQEMLAPTRTTPAQKQQYVMDKVERQQAGMAERTGMRVAQHDRALEFTKQKAVNDYVQKSDSNELKYTFDMMRTKLAHDQPLNQDELAVYQHLLDAGKRAGLKNVPASVLERSNANATYGAGSAAPGGATSATGAGPKNYPGYLTVFNADGSVGYVKQ